MKTGANSKGFCRFATKIYSGTGLCGEAELAFCDFKSPGGVTSAASISSVSTCCLPTRRLASAGSCPSSGMRCALTCGSSKGARSGVHAPQHFLYFLPLPHGHGSFLPVLGVLLLIREDAPLGSGFRLALTEGWAAPFARSYRKHAHHSISIEVSSTRRRCGFSASLART